MQLAAGIAGGVLLLVAVFLPWAARGAGSTIAARRVADLLLSGAVEAWAPTWLGVCVYLIPVAGALLFIGCGLGGRSGVVVATVALVTAGLVTGATVAALPRRHSFDLGTGALSAVVGTVLAAISVAAGWAGARRRLAG